VCVTASVTEHLQGSKRIIQIVVRVIGALHLFIIIYHIMTLSCDLQSLHNFCFLQFIKMELTQRHDSVMSIPTTVI